MGLRITNNLLRTDYNVAYVETADRGQRLLAERGIEVVSAADAIPGSRAVIPALPDNRIAQVVATIAPLLESGTMLIALDIAAPLAGAFPQRGDLEYFVTHPCHPSVAERQSRLPNSISSGAFTPARTLCAPCYRVRRRATPPANPSHAPSTRQW